MEILRIKINITSTSEVTGDMTVKMVGFNGICDGEYFCGRVTDGGIDTQKLDCNGNGTLSARYMLEGTDCENRQCHIFVENNAVIQNGIIGRTTPEIITDSSALNRLLQKKIYGTLDSNEEGLWVSIFTED
ncbi:MAG: DUF3237 domain-containing protein [Oscillospiraceae bacterium]|nr:DUF3237 domain-containing protein [Oscillospiraceae bacterium]